MSESPADLTSQAIRDCLRDRYGLTVTELSFLALGHDSSAWVYRAQTADDVAYFVKVRTSVANEASLLVPRFLHDQGIERVVAPLATGGGALWTTVATYALIVYPFIAGTAGMEHGLSDEQWIDLGAILKLIHTTAPTPDLAGRMRRETFVPVGGRTIEAVNGLIQVESYEGPAVHELAMFWRSRQEGIQTLLQRATALGRQLARKGLPLALCHADIHTNNVLLDADGQVWIVDWDETVLAPKERDLMFVLGGGISRALVGPRDEELFRQGYGETDTDPFALTYYRYARTVEDIAAFGEQVFFRPDLGADDKRMAVEYFQSLFLPGSIVDLAIGSDEQAMRCMRGRGRG